MTQFSRRRSVVAGLGGAALALGARRAAAQDARTGRAIVGFPPGGTADSVTRLYVEHMRTSGAAQMVVDNRPGAGGRLALELLKGLPADGSAFAMTPGSMLTIYPHLYARTLRYDPVADFTPVSPVCVFVSALAVAARHPAGTLAEFVAWGRNRPALDWASPVPGSAQHFLGTELARLAGLSMVHVPYRGAAPATTDLLSGTLNAVILPLGDLAPFHRAGEARILATSAPQRSDRLPDVPSFAEAGFPALTREETYGIVLPAGAPAPVVSALHAAITAAAAAPELRDALMRIDMPPAPMAPEAYRERLAREAAAWGPVVAASGFKPDE